MAQSNRPIDSREFKLMLKTTEFIDRIAGIKNVSNILQSQIENQNGEFKEDIEDSERQTWYLDTSRYDLNAKKFLFRIRGEKKANLFNVTLKCRHPDRYASAQHNLSSPIKHIKIKFEEDILSPFVSKFSLSGEFQEEQKPKIDTIKDLETVFPGIKSLDIPSTELLRKVNNFEAMEVAYKIGKVTFKHEKDVKTYLNFWYLSNEKKTPVIVEFTFNYSAKETNNSHGMVLEEFPRSLIKECDELYMSLQKNKLVDLRYCENKDTICLQYKP